jgi:hypothetical protein
MQLFRFDLIRGYRSFSRSYPKIIPIFVLHDLSLLSSYGILSLISILSRDIAAI